MNGTSGSRRYAALLFSGIALATVIAAAVNTRVDPWRVVGAPWADAAIDPYRDISASTRTGKAGLIRARDDWQAAIFGSSRVISSLNPQAPGWGDTKVVNLGMPGAFLFENIAMAEYFIANQPAETLLFGIDPGDLTSNLDTRPMGDFMASPLNPEGGIDRELRYIVGLSTFEASIETLGLQAKNQPGEYNAHGLRERSGRGGGAGGKSQLNFIKNRFIDDARIAPRSPESIHVNAGKARRLEDLMIHCREKGIRLVVFLHPNHVLLQAKSADVSNPASPYELDLRLLAEMVDRVNQLPGDAPPVEFWDFYSFHPINCEQVRPESGEPGMLHHWRDLEHFTKDVGEGMMSLMMGWPVDDPELRNYGEVITAENLERRIAERREAYHAYLDRELDGDVAWKEDLIARGVSQ